MGKPFYQVDVETTLNQLGTRITGLSATEVANIKARVGTNVIPKVKQSFLEKYIKPVINLMIVILFFAAILQFVLSGFTDYFGPGLILAILFINITIAMFQQIGRASCRERV